MSIIKEKIKYNNQDMNLKIKLGSHDSFIGYQQEIDNITQFTTTELVNPAIDVEMRRFKPYISTDISLQFQFYKSSNDTYGTSFENAGFTAYDLTAKNFNALNSFFFLEYYDSYDIYSQNKIFSSYLTKIGTAPNYIISPTSGNQFYCWYVPISYIESITGSSTATGYTKFSFYNAKTGKVQLFYNLNNDSLLTSEKMYFKTILNFYNKTWKISPIIIAKELKYNTNQLYVDRINNTFTNFENLAQKYPSGNTFSYSGNAAFYLTT